MHSPSFVLKNLYEMGAFNLNEKYYLPAVLPRFPKILPLNGGFLYVAVANSANRSTASSSRHVAIPRFCIVVEMAVPIALKIYKH
jgi:hypothetical protein